MSMMIHRNKKKRAGNDSETKEYESPLFSGNQENSHKYTKTEINRMTTEELQNLASGLQIENARSRSGGELKKILIDKFNL